ncbi:MAG TPA: FAD-dependent oxidoreductase [Thermomicrobiales bacterium]|nr:FAD-dependent oxidoreductase [Thermomicrobiales bacterium]
MEVGEAIVVGGGVIGSGIAYELARRRFDVTLIERGQIGGEATAASAGIISLPNRMDWRPERIELGRRSLARYPSLVPELEAAADLSLEYKRTGEWAIAVDAGHAAFEAERAAWQAALGFPIEQVDPAAARKREPALPETTVAAWHTPEAATITVRRLAQAYAQAAERLGATILEETPVASVAHADFRVAGVNLAAGTRHAPLVILACGAWTRFLGDSIDVNLPTKPVKGQLIAFRGGAIRPASVITGHGGYVRPRLDGTTIVAATEEDAGFDKRVTGDGVAWLLDLTRTICPTLLSGELVDAWSGLRPGSETHDPMIGPVAGWDGLWVAAGHFRTGAKEAPATAELVAQSILDGVVDPVLAPFAPPA